MHWRRQPAAALAPSAQPPAPPKGVLGTMDCLLARDRCVEACAVVCDQQTHIALRESTHVSAGGQRPPAQNIMFILT